MFTIETASYGIRMIMNGLIHEGETTWWFKEFTKILREMKPGFKLFINMQGLKPFPKAALKDIQRAQELLLNMGVARSILILDHPITTMQCKRLAKQTGMYDRERYIDASTESDWAQIALNWLEKGIDPDK